jgi:poly(A) polymerase
VPDPVVVPREAHPISRRDIDPDALRVLYRLQQNGHIAYLVGGSVRDLLLGRKPKDFDIGTDAHPYQIKRLFRNCWIIGRRFRLAHIKFGLKTIEVATFRKNVAELPAGPPEAPEPALPMDESIVVATAEPDGLAVIDGVLAAPASAESLAKAEQIHRDNTYGTTEEDAFRRDFTVNALFYDAATKTIIDYVGGLEDLGQRVIKSIGDPRVRFVEDPVRMLRAAVLGARLGFTFDPLVAEAIDDLRSLITKASPARLLEEYFKILRSGYAEVSFRALDRTGLLELMTPELKSAPPALWESLARLDRYRNQFPSAPPELTTAVLIGALLHPIGALKSPMPERGNADDTADVPERVSFGALPVARKDLDRLRQMLQTLPRLLDLQLPPRVARGLPHRPSFSDAVTWLEVFGDDAAAAESWKAIRTALPPRPQGPRQGQRHGRHRQGQGQRHGQGEGRGSGSPGPGPADHPHGQRTTGSAQSGGPADQGGGQRPTGDQTDQPRRRRRRRRRGGRGGGGGGGGTKLAQ